MAALFYTKTDEAPALATASLLPIVKAFTGTSGISVDTKDIGLAARIAAAFPDYLNTDQYTPDDLSFLGDLAKTPEANIIKLPNISASIPQLKAAIAELQEKGYPLPHYPDEPTNDEEEKIKSRYDAVKGSAVNPVLREGNSDRRAPKAVKNYAKKHPHTMGSWSPNSKTHVATMTQGDFRHSEQSITLNHADTVRIELRSEEGTTVLKANIALQKGEIIDAAVMHKAALVAFLTREIAEAQKEDLLLSLHLKATMMKVSDPILFGHALQVYFAALFETHGETLDHLGVTPSEGLESLLNKTTLLPETQRNAIAQAIATRIAEGPKLAMVDSDKGITNLHRPNDVIVDASMPAMIRNSGKMWDADGQLQDTKAIIPDSSYAGVYQAVIDFCKEHGAFDPTTMGTVPNVGLMAQKAEEYGSHDKTFEITQAGTVCVVSTSTGHILLEHPVEKGDLWRMCQVKEAPVQDWIQLAVTRAKATHTPAVFWLDEDRPHDAELIKKVDAALKQHDTEGLDLRILPPVQATQFTLKRLKEGKDTLSVTGNVLRDYLTDLFPILELGTSAKMLSIVPLMHGGGLFETGAGGSAPKHVEQFLTEGHLRWDSLGEFLALGASLAHYGEKNANTKASILADALDKATEKFLECKKSPSRQVHKLDTRGSHFYLALYWAEALAQQDKDPALQSVFGTLFEALSSNEAQITQELMAVQGTAVDIGGYYFPDAALVEKAMRPSTTFTTILDTIAKTIA